MRLVARNPASMHECIYKISRPETWPLGMKQAIFKTRPAMDAKLTSPKVSKA